jgi:hypothetical protein
MGLPYYTYGVPQSPRLHLPFFSFLLSVVQSGQSQLTGIFFFLPAKSFFFNLEFIYLFYIYLHVYTLFVTPPLLAS